MLRCGLALYVLCGVASAQTVSLNGSMGGDRALLVIDGKPRTLAVGNTVDGVRLLKLSEGQAQVEVGGKVILLRIGAAPGRVGEASLGGGTRIVLSAGLGGHFVTGGSINGRAVEFLVDTGASTVTMSQVDADRMGIEYQNAPRVVGNTANGQALGYLVTLRSVRVGDVEVYQVPAAILAVPAMHSILLGNSFLSRFQMKRENDTLVLDKRP